ncbi:hypothetical protein SAMN03159496_04263 [Rhizobium sp. NFR07]|uniref:hypothetical protein n=1 Tax=Rhizobium sp. NFR07 TaxID=1566262 RepID=UPI0008EE6E63|nr:hypothetical protein [Rhizobium sp. NFR07]SFB48934.1 hypothetical protein SAMN03159496_04263 [Rhizobium sp. NFR07]
MKAAFASLLLAAVLAQSADAATLTYGGVPIVEGSDMDLRFQAAREFCMVEASTPLRGTPRTENFYYRISLKSCLYRQGYFGDGSYVYPVPLYGQPTVAR